MCCQKEWIVIAQITSVSTNSLVCHCKFIVSILGSFSSRSGRPTTTLNTRAKSSINSKNSIRSLFENLPYKHDLNKRLSIPCFTQPIKEEEEAYPAATFWNPTMMPSTLFSQPLWELLSNKYDIVGLSSFPLAASSQAFTKDLWNITSHKCTDLGSIFVSDHKAAIIYEYFTIVGDGEHSDVWCY